MDKPLWPKKFHRLFNPGRVVNICFIVVLFFSTLLIWREIRVLEEAYVANQRNNLENVAHEMDGLLQFNLNRLLFFRNSMQSALENPLDFAILRRAEQEYISKRHDPIWSVELNNRRTLTVYGVSDSFVDADDLLSRNNPQASNELMATLELGYLLRLTNNNRIFSERMSYVSRSGFYTTTDAPRSSSQVLAQFSRDTGSAWFMRQTQRDNPGRGILWQTTQQEDGYTQPQVVTASIPLDYEHYWLGGLAMDFSIRDLQNFLVSAVKGGQMGEYQLYDKQLNLLASSAPDDVLTPLSPKEQEQLRYALANDNHGGIRQLTRYISWEKIRNFDGVLLHIHTLKEGVRGDFGTISIALTLMWLMFTLMLIVSWGVIRRMVINMSVLQASLEWQAWHDALTRLLNRGALFERAIAAARSCRRNNQPISVIQLDLDYFKGINDKHGHQAGDRVLTLVGSTIMGQIREQDIAGRVGGEEFCIVLPNTQLPQARAIAERIRLRIHSREILLHNSVSLRISASLGISSSETSDEFNFEELQSIADHRLYLAKQNGRNRVCSAG